MLELKYIAVLVIVIDYCRTTFNNLSLTVVRYQLQASRGSLYPYHPLNLLFHKHINQEAIALRRGWESKKGNKNFLPSQRGFPLPSGSIELDKYIHRWLRKTELICMCFNTSKLKSKKMLYKSFSFVWHNVLICIHLAMWYLRKTTNPVWHYNPLPYYDYFFTMLLMIL